MPINPNLFFFFFILLLINRHRHSLLEQLVSLLPLPALQCFDTGWVVVIAWPKPWFFQTLTHLCHEKVQAMGGSCFQAAESCGVWGHISLRWWGGPVVLHWEGPDHSCRGRGKGVRVDGRMWVSGTWVCCRLRLPFFSNKDENPRIVY